MEGFKNGIALVTGAASGIGRATAELLASEGARVALLDINAVNGHGTTEGLKNGGRDCIFVRADISDEEQVRAVVSEMASRLGPIDTLINNSAALINNSAAFVFRAIDATVVDWTQPCWYLENTQ